MIFTRRSDSVTPRQSRWAYSDLRIPALHLLNVPLGRGLCAFTRGLSDRAVWTLKGYRPSGSGSRGWRR